MVIVTTEFSAHNSSDVRETTQVVHQILKFNLLPNFFFDKSQHQNHCTKHGASKTHQRSKTMHALDLLSHPLKKSESNSNNYSVGACQEFLV